MGGDIDGFLAGRRVNDEQDFLRLHEVAEVDEFLHQRRVNLEAAGGVENDGVVLVCLGESEGVAGDFEHIGRALLYEDGDFQFRAERGELVHRGGAVNVGGDEQDVFPLLLEQAGEFTRTGRLARAMQPAQEDAGGPGREDEAGVLGAEQAD